MNSVLENRGRNKTTHVLSGSDQWLLASKGRDVLHNGLEVSTKLSLLNA